MDRSVTIKAWTTKDAVCHVYPELSDTWPDAHLLPMLKEWCRGSVCEVGCGTGRCSEAFAPDDYVGVDINKYAIKEARRLNPRHSFCEIGWDSEYPDSDVFLFFTVLLHIPDSELGGVLDRATGRIVIYETMDRELRDESHCCFNRSSNEYVSALRDRASIL